jgi:anti-sigma regulatory factor (Ser/Thr protein kinase)
MIVMLAQPEDVGAARRDASAVARAAEFDATATGHVALVATELASNMVKHAGKGMLAISPYDDADGRGVELLAIDAGPGMRDLARCLGDGYSTAGSAGTGLGAVRRMSTELSVFTRLDGGTVAMARLRGPGRPSASPSLFQVGAVAVTYPGETVSGDAWQVSVDSGVCRLLMADGSGHGPLAAEAAGHAVRLFESRPDLPPATAIEQLHHGLAAGRGAAVAIAWLDLATRQVRYAGLGNIAATLMDGGQRKRMVSLDGTAGHRAGRIKEFIYPFGAPDPIVILHSDGLTARWDIEAYAGLLACHASVIAGVLYRDHQRGRDDATVLVVKGLKR